MVPLFGEQICLLDMAFSQGMLSFILRRRSGPMSQAERKSFIDFASLNFVLIFPSVNPSPEIIKSTLMLIADTGKSRGEVLHPVRFALSGKDKSPDPFTLAEVLGKPETVDRIKIALKKLN